MCTYVYVVDGKHVYIPISHRVQTPMPSPKEPTGQGRQSNHFPTYNNKFIHLLIISVFQQIFYIHDENCLSNTCCFSPEKGPN